MDKIPTLLNHFCFSFCKMVDSILLKFIFVNSCIINIYKQSTIFNNTISLFLTRGIKNILLFYSNPIFHRKKLLIHTYMSRIHSYYMKT